MLNFCLQFWYTHGSFGAINNSDPALGTLSLRTDAIKRAGFGTFIHIIGMAFHLLSMLRVILWIICGRILSDRMYPSLKHMLFCFFEDLP